MVITELILGIVKVAIGILDALCPLGPALAYTEKLTKA
jgi:hypothetical protein